MTATIHRLCDYQRKPRTDEPGPKAAEVTPLPKLSAAPTIHDGAAGYVVWPPPDMLEPCDV